MDLVWVVLVRESGDGEYRQMFGHMSTDAVYRWMDVCGRYCGVAWEDTRYGFRGTYSDTVFWVVEVGMREQMQIAGEVLP